MGPSLPKNIFARNCSVRRIDRITAKSFLDVNHRFGDASSRYHYGLFTDRFTGSTETALPEGSLVAVSEFSSARKMQDGSRSCEWVRYASLRDTRVVGGMGKMLEHFVREVGPDDVMSYAADCDGDAYKALGFTLEAEKTFSGGEAFPGEHKSLKYRKRFTHKSPDASKRH